MGQSRGEGPLQIYRAILEISTSVGGASAEAMEGALALALDRLAHLFGADRSYLFRLFSPSECRMTHCWPGDDATRKLLSALKPSAMPWLCEQVAAGVVHLKTATELPPQAQAERAYFEHASIGSMLLVGLKRDGVLIGLLGLDRVGAQRAWSTLEVEQIGAVAGIIAGALMRHFSEVRFRTLFEHTTDAVMMLNASGFIECNQATLGLFGCPDRQAFVGLHPSELSPPRQEDGSDSIAVSAARIQQAYDEGSCRFEWLHRRADNGLVFPAEVLLVAMMLDGQPVLQAVVRDITQRRRLQETLQTERDLFARGPCVVFKWAPEPSWPVRYVSPNITTVLGYLPEDLMAGRPPFAQMVHPDDLPRVAQEVEAYLASGVRSFEQEYRVRHQDGRWLWVEDHTTVEYTGDNQPECINGYMIDITNQKNINEELSKRVEEEIAKRRESEKMLYAQARVSTMGEMVSAISHHWRQPLSIMAIAVQSIQEDYHEGLLEANSLERSVQMCMKEVQTMSRSIDLLRGLVPDRASRQSTVLAELKAACEVIAPELALHRIGLVMRCFGKEAASPDVCHYPDSAPISEHAISKEFRQVIFGLLLNARDAILSSAQECGEIVISLDLDRGCEKITIDDNGGGFKLAAIDRAFDPFFTTKERGQGKGVISGVGNGLYIAKLVIEEQMGGTIGIENTALGARIKVMLPINKLSRDHHRLNYPHQ